MLKVFVYQMALLSYVCLQGCIDLSEQMPTTVMKLSFVVVVLCILTNSVNSNFLAKYLFQQTKSFCVPKNTSSSPFPTLNNNISKEHKKSHCYIGPNTHLAFCVTQWPTRGIWELTSLGWWTLNY